MQKNIILKRGAVFALFLFLLVGSIYPTVGKPSNDTEGKNFSIFNINRITRGLSSCNHLAYISADYPVNCALSEFILNDPGDLTCTCSEGGGMTFPTCGTWINDGKIITTEYMTGILYEIDPETCEWNPIGGGGTGLDGLTYDPTSNVLYGCTGYSLYKINLETGEQDYVGEISGGPGLMAGLACNADGILYGWDLLQDSLWEIDKDTAEATLIGSLGINLIYNTDGHFCMEDNILYLADNHLYECDTETGSLNSIGPFEENAYADMIAIPWDNLPPYPPNDPNPQDGATNVSLLPSICWTGGDPDPEDTVMYDVYFGESSPPPMWLANYNGNCKVIPFQLNPCKTYYWQIVAWDNHGAANKGPIWSFITTCDNLPPTAPYITGPKNGRAGVEYEWTFVSTDPEEHNITYYIDFGDQCGGAEYHGPYPSGQELVLAHTYPYQSTFTINALAIDSYGAQSNWSYYEVTMPRNKLLYNSLFLQFLEKFLFLESLFNFWGWFN